MRQECQPERDGQYEENQHAPAGFLGQALAIRERRGENQHKRNDEFDEISRAEADGVQARDERSEQVEDIHWLVNLFET